MPKGQNRGGKENTDVDDDCDAVGQREVITELALHYIEVLSLVLGFTWRTTIRTGLGKGGQGGPICVDVRYVARGPSLIRKLRDSANSQSTQFRRAHSWSLQRGLKCSL